MPEDRNVLGEKLDTCSIRPMTGFYRTGCCETGAEDAGAHVVCFEVTEEFLAFSKTRGNDLSTPVPEMGFPGLKPGDRWCLCATRWKRRSMSAWHRASCCGRRMRKRSNTCRSRLSKRTHSTLHDQPWLAGIKQLSTLNPHIPPRFPRSGGGERIVATARQPASAEARCPRPCT